MILSPLPLCGPVVSTVVPPNHPMVLKSATEFALWASEGSSLQTESQDAAQTVHSFFQLTTVLPPHSGSLHIYPWFGNTLPSSQGYSLPLGFPWYLHHYSIQTLFSLLSIIFMFSLPLGSNRQLPYPAAPNLICGVPCPCPIPKSVNVRYPNRRQVCQEELLLVHSALWQWRRGYRKLRPAGQEADQPYTCTQEVLAPDLWWNSGWRATTCLQQSPPACPSFPGIFPTS